jgi:hypothetical protein
MVKIYAASQTPRIYGSGAGTLDTTPFLLFDETLPTIASPTTLGYGEHVELTSPVTVGLPNPRKGAKLVIRNMSGGYSSVAAGAILYKGNTYTSLDFNTNTVALLRVVDGVWTASFVTEGAPFSSIVATGGTVTEFTDLGAGITYRVHSFTSVGSSMFTVSSLGDTSGEVEYLVVAGGGGVYSIAGSRGGAGGGGAGGVKEDSAIISVSSYTALVGDGGSNSSTPSAGGNSEFLGITCLGGGKGVQTPGEGPNNGGSGAGGGIDSNTTSTAIPPGAALQPASTSGGLGFNGGIGSTANSGTMGGGGGAGGNTSNGHGGQGVYYGHKFGNNLGDNGWFAGGGAGDTVASGSGPAGLPGGQGGGGDSQQDGMPGTGGGGGGKGHSSGPGGQGGSGFIAVRYAIVYP